MKAFWDRKDLFIVIKGSLLLTLLFFGVKFLFLLIDKIIFGFSLTDIYFNPFYQLFLTIFGYIIGYGLYVLAGIYVGRAAKERGWLYAAISTVIFWILTIIITFLIVLSPWFIGTNNQKFEYLSTFVVAFFKTGTFINLLPIILLTSFGGWVGQKMIMKNNTHIKANS